MLSYSSREIRRRGDHATVGCPGVVQSAVSLMSFVLIGVGAVGAGTTTPASTAPPSPSVVEARSSE